MREEEPILRVSYDNSRARMGCLVDFYVKKSFKYMACQRAIEVEAEIHE